MPNDLIVTMVSTIVGQVEYDDDFEKATLLEPQRSILAENNLHQQMDVSINNAYNFLRPVVASGATIQIEGVRTFVGNIPIIRIVGFGGVIG